MFELISTATAALVCAVPLVCLDIAAGTSPVTPLLQRMRNMFDNNGSTGDYVDALQDASDYEADSYGAEFIAAELIGADDMVSELLADWDSIGDDYDAIDDIDPDTAAYLDAVYGEHVDSEDRESELVDYHY